MSFYLQCNISLQDCNALYPRATSQQAYFTNTSCVQDPRLSGNIGRCGWAGAPCYVNGTVSNCAWPYAEVCESGVCIGGVGEPCIPFDVNYQCNAPVYCNVTVGLGYGAICGGEGATVNTEDASKGLNFGLDYCLSGVADQLNTSYWTCSAGNDGLPILPTSISSSSPGSPSSLTTLKSNNSSKSKLIGPIVGGVVGGLMLFLLLVFCWRRQQKQPRVDPWSENQEPVSLLHRRGLSNQSQATTRTTTTSRSHVTPYYESPSEMRSAGINPRREFGHIQKRVPAPADPPAAESLVVLAPDSSTTSSHPMVKATVRSAPHMEPSASTSSPESVSQELPSIVALPMPSAVTFVTSPTRAHTRQKSQNTSSSSLHHVRLYSLPDTPPVSTEGVEQRLLELRDEAERGLAEIRAQRTGDDEIMPPPYHLP